MIPDPRPDSDQHQNLTTSRGSTLALPMPTMFIVWSTYRPTYVSYLGHKRQNDQQNDRQAIRGANLVKERSCRKALDQSHHLQERSQSFSITLFIQERSCKKSKMATVNDVCSLTADFKVTPLFDAEYLRNGTRYKHSYNGISIGTYTRPTEGCHFE